jgi:cyclopropane-fatty-acyl-phospholipid synthase
MAVSWLVDQGFVPDRVVRAGIRRMLTQRAVEARASRAEPGGFEKYREDLRKSPLAVATEAANEQHYEVPAGFFELCLGPHLKYSACECSAEDLPRWPELRDRKALGAAEESVILGF